MNIFSVVKEKRDGNILIFIGASNNILRNDCKKKRCFEFLVLMRENLLQLVSMAMHEGGNVFMAEVKIHMLQCCEVKNQRHHL